MSNAHIHAIGYPITHGLGIFFGILWANRDKVEKVEKYIERRIGERRHTMNLLTHLGLINKIVDAITSASNEIGPLVGKEVQDGEALWKDVQNALNDLKVSVSAVATAVNAPKAA